MLLYGQHHRELGGDKCVLTNTLDDIVEFNFRSESVSVINDGVVVRAIPAIHCRGEGCGS